MSERDEYNVPANPTTGSSMTTNNGEHLAQAARRPTCSEYTLVRPKDDTGKFTDSRGRNASTDELISLSVAIVA